MISESVTFVPVVVPVVVDGTGILLPSFRFILLRLLRFLLMLLLRDDASFSLDVHLLFREKK